LAKQRARSSLDFVTAKYTSEDWKLKRNSPSADPLLSKVVTMNEYPGSGTRQRPA